MTTTAIHLNFDGDAREALEFYASVVEGDLMVATYGDMGLGETAGPERVMFGQVSADGFRVMAYDVPAGSTGPAGPVPSTYREGGATYTTAPYFLSLRGGNAAEVTALWEKLSVGATVIEPLAPAPWAPAFGMLTDRFGVSWIVDVAVEYGAGSAQPVLADLAVERRAGDPES